MDGAEPRRATILLVDDEPMLAEALRRVLVSAGFDVLVCRTAMDALPLLQAGAPSVDLVLTDVQLPVMTGDRLAREIRRACPGLPVVLMTGFSTTVTRENAHLIGVVTVLQKPVPPDLLVAAIRNAIRGAAEEESCLVT
ncbi:MAG TPA: response regulator [Gemmatimonadaceae bacterium]|nr:response regulator [Gemmatimonadaceae bacterium]